ncbi:hypothetical protein ACFY0G_23940 [Streptomyces sp. NPDC001552]|uniref:hypothetical protein n=1 Tax=Streptomyces sp. NPDC001552 TaxID=3364587 RepID=UPI0036C30A08
MRPGTQLVRVCLAFVPKDVEDGSVIGWGANALGQLGDGTTTAPASTTTALPPGSQITHVSATLTGKSGFAY